MARETEVRPTRMRTHTVTIDDRARISITDVEDVESFNDTEIVLRTGAEGGLTITGENLHISKLNLDDGQLVVEGLVFGLDYDGGTAGEGGGGFFSRIFG